MRRHFAALLITWQAATLVTACQVAAPALTPKPAPRATKTTAPAGADKAQPTLPPSSGAGSTPQSITPELPDSAPTAQPLPLKTQPLPLTPQAPRATPIAMLGSSLFPLLNASGVVSNNSGSAQGPGVGMEGPPGASPPPSPAPDLSGRVLAPASLTPLPARSFRLAALPTQSPVAKLPVGLLDASGMIARDADDQPYLTHTGPDGAYAFAQVPSDRAFLVLVDLPEGRGQLAALAIAAGAPPGPRTVDLDLVSTLTTGYLYSQYVASQPDRAGVLARLGSDVEAATRRKAEAAFTASGAGVPARLGPAEVATTVAAMRAADAGFDGQLEAIKRQLGADAAPQ